MAKFKKHISSILGFLHQNQDLGNNFAWFCEGIYIQSEDTVMFRDFDEIAKFLFNFPALFHQLFPKGCSYKK